ncbi:putative flavoprotein involved in K+ transport [Nocardioides luteus]|uniref:FAD-dependent oxidoreductase n=1 Tax=Nocardioides luteus TaxID=1844 RepID=A0ABQ5T347_9ACTN|nr:MSMEG_0569 family flavin-dependent oxidoreductase [Nocardioides luteus]MDR7310321.1 putative flavoprotein involved in K+ transport [Nocardioides luteus]GGR53470.1 FAD-dependent oxidoreductase [Nocardioides luteus]GLJ69899.1 FAD-dependent oxidoreductase [Nocardioides luteus]
MTDHRTTVAIIGGGQAGLSASWFLVRDGVDHVVLEAGTLGHEWADTRWDNFTLVTPNWHCRLPGYEYAGPDPDGFMTRDEVVSWLAGYAPTFGPPVREHTKVTSLTQRAGGGFLVEAEGPDGEETWEAEHVVVATGGYHVPVVPSWAPALDPGVDQLHSADYRNASALRPGGVLVVGSGQSGAQIAEDLHLEGRQVHLAIGDAPRVARFHRGRDCMTWLAEMGLYDTPVASYPGGLAAREKTNHYVTGRDGGRDIDLRQFAAEGMRLYGRLASGAGTDLTFAPTLRAALDSADDVYRSICRDIDTHIEAHGLDAPPAAPYAPVWEPDSDPTGLDLAEAGITSIVWAIGYRPDYRWVRVGVFDGTGRPTHTRGVTAVPGLHFLGLPWMHTWGSGRFLGIAADAEHVTDVITGRGGRVIEPAAELARRRSPGPVDAAPAVA